MKIRRRDLLKLGLAQAVIGSLPFKVFADRSQKTTPSILQGATDENNTQFNIVYNISVNLEVFVTTALGQIFQTDKLEVFTFPGHDKKITRIFFSGLNPNVDYFLNVVDTDSKVFVDRRQFKTMDLNLLPLKFVMASCFDHERHSADIWQNMVTENPQVIFFIGDQVYTDREVAETGADPAHLWKKFCDARATLEIYFSKKLIPIIATWDDHDFGMNNGYGDSGNGNYRWVAESQQNFNLFMAQEESHCRWLKRGPGVSSAFQYAGQLFLLTDGRSFRKASDSQERYAHWGQAQENWLIDLIEKTQGPTWFINGTQVFPTFIQRESVAGRHPVQFAGLLERIRPIPHSKVIFVSGDIHYSEISQIEAQALGYETYELTSSAVHSFCVPGLPGFIKNPRRISITDQRNFMLIESREFGPGAEFQVTALSGQGQRLFERRLRVI